MLRKKSHTKRNVAIGATAAGIAGYLAGILTAPKSGKETRKDLSSKASDVKDVAEAQLAKLASELSDALKAAKAKSGSLSAKARDELNDAMVKAKDAQNKASQVLKAFKDGEADNAELNRAVKQSQQALNNLKRYLKS